MNRTNLHLQHITIKQATVCDLPLSTHRLWYHRLDHRLSASRHVGHLFASFAALRKSAFLESLC
jgi:hypothetical protein